MQKCVCLANYPIPQQFRILERNLTHINCITNLTISQTYISYLVLMRHSEISMGPCDIYLYKRIIKVVWYLAEIGGGDQKKIFDTRTYIVTFVYRFMSSKHKSKEYKCRICFCGDFWRWRFISLLSAKHRQWYIWSNLLYGLRTHLQVPWCCDCPWPTLIFEHLRSRLLSSCLLSNTACRRHLTKLQWAPVVSSCYEINSS